MLYYKRRLKFCLYIPLEIQIEIIKRIPDVKSLVRFKSVSKSWNSFINSSEFIAFYGVRSTQPHRLNLIYRAAGYPFENRYICSVDDDNHTFTQQQQDCASTLSTITKQHIDLPVIGCSHGLLCFHGRASCGEKKVVLLNPSIRKSVVIVVPFPDNDIQINYGFGVCPVTNDPSIVRFSSYPWHAEVFILSSGVWNALPCSNMPCDPIKLKSSQVVIGSFIYWFASKKMADDAGCWKEYLIISFDLIAKEFRVVDIPYRHGFELMNDTLCLSISKRMESLILFLCRGHEWDVRKMEPDCSFTKLFIINPPDYQIHNIYGFRKNGELVVDTEKEDEESAATLEIYDPISERISCNLGIHGESGSFFMSSYKETLLLLDHSDSYVYPVITDD